MLTLEWYYWCQQDNFSEPCDRREIIGALRKGNTNPLELIFLGRLLYSETLSPRCIECLSLYCEELHQELLV